MNRVVSFKLVMQVILLSVSVNSAQLVSADDGAILELQGQLKQMHTFSATFQQTVYGRSFEKMQASSGNISLLRPLKFRWELVSPYPQLIVTSGEVLYIYDPDLQQVQVRPAGQALRGTPALLLAGELEDIGHFFEVEQIHDFVDTPLGNAITSSETTLQDSSVFSLSPKSADSLYSEIRLFFSRGIPLAIEIRDSLGQLTRVDFQDQKLNTKLAEDEFEFEIPQGTDVVGDAELSAS